MRESNFAFPAQNRACVCISSQLYDRRALDTASALPLFNSLTHLTYLTSTSPRIREIMTMDGGLERLVRILHDFCICPPPPDNPAILYGLTPPNARPPKLVPTLNPSLFDKHAAYRFSLAFQCVVNIGVRGSENIRSRVVQAGTLDVVGCILEAWLAGKGFAVGPSSSATGIPRETREQRLARRQAAAEQREREQAAELSRALQRQIQVENISAEVFEQDDSMIDISAPDSSSLSLSDPPSSTATSVENVSDADTSTDTSTTATPIRSNTPTGTVLVPVRDRGGTIIGRTTWDHLPMTAGRRRRNHDDSRPDTETEDDGDGDVDMDRTGVVSEASPSPEPRATHLSARARRAVGIVSDDPDDGPLEVNADAHIIINNDGGGVIGGDGVGVEDGIVSLETNDDFAMGAPPGAPGAIGDEGGGRRGMVEEGRGRRGTVGPDLTPRQVTMTLPGTGPVVLGRAGTLIAAPAAQRTRDPTTIAPTRTTVRTHHHHHHHHRGDTDSGPYRDEDVLLSLQLLAYLSKYPHVRQAFYKPRATFHPASVHLPGRGGVPLPSLAGIGKDKVVPSTLVKEAHGFFKAFSGRGKEKVPPSVASSSTVVPPTPTATTRHTNVFSLVERFTFRPSSTETDLPNPPPKLPSEIQYWAGVIMRNACRKDESRGGIRQCANMLCGRWETYPREFAKCRRCRKAKYCGKECQSTAWSEGHRFWCSAKEGDEDADPTDSAAIAVDVPVIAGAGGGGSVTVTNAAMTARVERRVERERERQRAFATVAANGQEATQAARSAVATLRAAANPNAFMPPTTGTGIGNGDHRALFSSPPPPHILANRAAAAARQATLIRNLQMYGRPAGAADVNLGPPNREVLYHYQRTLASNVDAAGRRRAETVTGASTTTPEATRSRTSRDEAGPSAARGRRRLGEDGAYGHDMVVE